MIKHLLLCAAFTALFPGTAALAGHPAGFWQNPVIKSAGSMHPLPDAAFQPDKTATYKALFVINENSKDPKAVNHGFEHVAMAVNVFASAGVPLDQLKFVVIVRGAVPAVLDNQQYQKQFHTNNPNLKVIHELESAGVQVAVCGQAVAGWNEDYNWIDPSVKVALSGLSTIVILQHEGYALMEL